MSMHALILIKLYMDNYTEHESTKYLYSLTSSEKSLNMKSFTCYSPCTLYHVTDLDCMYISQEYD